MNVLYLIFLVGIYPLLSNANEVGSLYKFNWLDEDEVVYVLQNKEFPKEKRIGVDLILMDSDSSSYQSTKGLGGSVYYNFTETFGLDLTYKRYSNSDNQALKNLQNLGDDGVKPLIRKVDSALLLHLNWIPFYGKVNTFNKILYFDWGLGAGGGQFSTQTNYPTFEDTNVPLKYISEDVFGFNLKTFFRFYVTENVTLGFQYDYSGFKAVIDSKKSEDFIFYNDFILNVGYLF